MIMRNCSPTAISTKRHVVPPCERRWKACRKAYYERSSWKRLSEFIWDFLWRMVNIWRSVTPKRYDPRKKITKKMRNLLLGIWNQTETEINRKLKYSQRKLKLCGVHGPSGRRRCSSRDLGVTLDTRLSFQRHVDSFYINCATATVSPTFSSRVDDALCTLVQAFTTSSVDTTVYYTVTLCCMASLRRSLVVAAMAGIILYAAARLITGVRRNQHITHDHCDAAWHVFVTLHILFTQSRPDGVWLQCVRGQGPRYFDDVLVGYQFTPLELVLDYDLQIMETWSSRVRVLCDTVCAASASPHHLCGTTFHPNWWTATLGLVDRVSNVVKSWPFERIPILVTGAPVNFV